MYSINMYILHARVRSIVWKDFKLLDFEGSFLIWGFIWKASNRIILLRRDTKT